MVYTRLRDQVEVSRQFDLAVWPDDLAVVSETSAKYGQGFIISPTKKSDAASGLGRLTPLSVVTTS